MLTRIEGTVVPNSALGPFLFERILDYYDGPRLMLQKSYTGQLILAWWNDEDSDTQRWLHVPVSEHRLHEIMTGQVTCLDALMYPEDGFIYVLDDNVKDESRTRTILAEPSALPEESLPYPGVRFDFDLPEEMRWMEARERSHLLDIRFHGDSSVPEGRVSAKTMGRAVDELQKLIDAIGQALEQDSPNMMGRIPNSIIEQTRLDPVSAYSGSFGIRLESHEQDGMSGKSLIRSSLDKFYDLLDFVVDLRGTSMVSKLGPRVDRRFKAFLYTLTTSPGDITFVWVKPYFDKPRKVTLEAQPFRKPTLR